MIPWSLFAKGTLARKPSQENLASLRVQTDPVQKRFFSDEAFNTMMAHRVSEVADAHGVPMAQVALAWVLSKSMITAPIIGATKPYHLDDAVAVVALQLTPDEINHLENSTNRTQWLGLRSHIQSRGVWARQFSHAIRLNFPTSGE